MAGGDKLVKKNTIWPFYFDECKKQKRWDRDVRKRDGLRERETEFQPRRIVTVWCWYSENAADLSDDTALHRASTITSGCLRKDHFILGSVKGESHLWIQDGTVARSQLGWRSVDMWELECKLTTTVWKCKILNRFGGIITQPYSFPYYHCIITAVVCGSAAMLVYMNIKRRSLLKPLYSYDF